VLGEGHDGRLFLQLLDRALRKHPRRHEVPDPSSLPFLHNDIDRVGPTFSHGQISEEDLDGVSPWLQFEEMRTPTPSIWLTINGNGWCTEEQEEGQWEERRFDL
jgi:hypothetical protein